MKHTLVSCELAEKSTHWKDRMADWHRYKIKTLCPVTGKTVTETVTGTKDKAIQSCLEHPDCPCQD
jgi:hypothetical protein